MASCSGSVTTTLNITTTSLPQGRVGTPYSATLSASGTSAVAWDLTEGTLPAGLTLDAPSSTPEAALAGTPNQAGTFVFVVRAQAVGQSTSRELQISVAPALVNGWTEFVPESGARTVYVSSSLGDDSWPGTEAQPVQTLEAGIGLLRDGYPDWMLLRRGDSWQLTSDFRFQPSGPSVGSGWMRLGAYGAPGQPRPILDAGDGGYLAITPGYQSSKRMSRIAITDVHFHASSRLADSSSATSTQYAISFIAVDWQGKGFAFSDIHIENVRITGFHGGILSGSDVTNLTIRRNIIDHIFTPEAAGGGGNGILSTPTHALIEENVLYRIQSADIPGVAADPSLPTHAVYGPAGAVDTHARGNIVIKACDGMMLRHGGDWVRNVSAWCRIAGVIGQAWGVDPTPGGVVANMQDSLVLNATHGPMYRKHPDGAGVTQYLCARSGRDHGREFAARCRKRYRPRS